MATTPAETIPTENVARRLTQFAKQMPDATAVIECHQSRRGKWEYRKFNFHQLDTESELLAQGLVALGVTPGMRLALMVKPGFHFVCLVFALLKSGAVQILIDPGMGRKRLLTCLEEVTPQGFVALPIVHAVRSLLRRRFPESLLHVTVGRRWGWGGFTLEQVRAAGERAQTPLPATRGEDPAAIIFTTGSTGPPKGVLYAHQNFDGQIDLIRERFDIQPGGRDLSCFPLFALFNGAMGMTTVFPQMDSSRPASVPPLNIIQPLQDLEIQQSFASPAVWKVVGEYCQQHDVKLPHLRRVLSAGAPVPVEVLEMLLPRIHAEGDIHTPYGATEALPVASINGRQVLAETAAGTRRGLGVCVGSRFDHIRWRVVRIRDEALATLADTEELLSGEIGELIVTGPTVTRAYYNRPQANSLGKIRDDQTVWHRMGDVGYRDEKGRFWFCGRMAHRVVTPDDTLFTIPCEAIFNNHPQVSRSALVGIGARGQQRPVLIVQPIAGTTVNQQQLFAELRVMGSEYPHTRSICSFLVHPQFPVDIRHNAKIFREQLAVWAEGELRGKV